MRFSAELENRLKKRFRHLARWAEREGTTAFRAYDRDLPQAPWQIDWYAGKVAATEVVTSAARRLDEDERAAEQAEVVLAVTRALGVAEGDVFVKSRARRLSGQQHEKLAHKKSEVIVEEHGLRLVANLSDYLDTGVFLDHRPLRRRVGKLAGGKRVLNLFCYTGAFTVHAAAAGASETVGVDLSNTYLAWAEKNLALNDLAAPNHRFVREDALSFLAERSAKYDVIVCDPPTMSRSKSAADFDVQRDHVRLVRLCAERLSPGGVLFFSTNARKFVLDPAAVAGLVAKDITAETIPEDFRADAHKAWEIARQ